jgi:Fe-S cluster assembly ATP-binding protein
MPFERAVAGLYPAMRTPPRCPACASTPSSPKGCGPGADTTDLSPRGPRRRIGFDERFLSALNVDLSGGEKKRNETLQLAVRPPHRILTSWTRPDLDARLRPAGRGGDARERSGVLAITHYNRLLHELKPDFVHIMVKGRIVASGGPELAEELERDGYRAFAPVEADAARRPTGPDPFADPFA